MGRKAVEILTVAIFVIVFVAVGVLVMTNCLNTIFALYGLPLWGIDDSLSAVVGVWLFRAFTKSTTKVEVKE